MGKSMRLDYVQRHYGGQNTMVKNINYTETSPWSKGEGDCKRNWGH